MKANGKIWLGTCTFGTLSVNLKLYQDKVTNKNYMYTDWNRPSEALFSGLSVT